MGSARDRYKGDKGKAWEALSLFVRARDRVCFTCNNDQGLQGGHWFPIGWKGSNNEMAWDDRNVHAQCRRCNGPLQGAGPIYTEKMLLRGFTPPDMLNATWMTFKAKDWPHITRWYALRRSVMEDIRIEVPTYHPEYTRLPAMECLHGLSDDAIKAYAYTGEIYVDAI